MKKNKRPGLSAIYYIPLVMAILPVLLYATITKRRPLHGHYQLMVVLTNGWDELQGNIYCFNLERGKWRLKFTNQVVVGGKGMGLGDGIITLKSPGAPVKKEGDLKSPAGIFTTGSAFGYADKKEAGWIKNHYIKASDTLICVDDAQSPDYNRLVQSDTIKSAYNSHEDMHRKDDDYKWGLFLNHNVNGTTPGAGSCIFMHIWQDNKHGTAGCTAMEEGNIVRLLHWIDAGKKPLLVQMPLAVYQKIRLEYRLPGIKNIKGL